MRTIDEIKAAIAATTLAHGAAIEQSLHQRDALHEDLKNVTKEINKARSDERSALRKLHTELGAAVLESDS